MLCNWVKFDNNSWYKTTSAGVYIVITFIDSRLSQFYASNLVIYLNILDKNQLIKLSSYNTIWATARQNKQNDMCAQQWLRSAWASAQSDQSLHCPYHFVGFVVRRLIYGKVIAVLPFSFINFLVQSNY